MSVRRDHTLGRFPRRFLRRLLHRDSGVGPRTGFEDGFASFDAARRAAGGYDSPAILERVLIASRAVAEGRAVHERDSVNFDQIVYSVPVLAGILLAAARSGGRLAVLDVGGSLGSTFRQNRRVLEELEAVRWAVVEQEGFVAAGRREFQNDRLSFHSTIADAANIRPNVAVLSSVCQYLSDPYQPIRELADVGVDVLVIDRTPVRDDPEDLPTLQHVPPKIYPASYPAWILSRQRLLSDVQRSFRIVDEFPTLEKGMSTTSGLPFSWIGLVAVRERSAA